MRLKSKLALRLMRPWLVALAVTLLGGCEDYFARRDTVTLSAGNAAAHNIAVQTIDPWAAHAENARIDMDGKRSHVAVKKYQQNKAAKPQGLGSKPPSGASASGGGKEAPASGAAAAEE